MCGVDEAAGKPSELPFRTAAPLEANGYDVVHVESGDAVVNLEAHGPEDNILIEPTNGGFVLERIRTSDEHVL